MQTVVSMLGSSPQEEFISRRIAERDDGMILDIYFRSWGSRPASMIAEVCK